MAGRRVCSSSKAVAVAMAVVALLALLLAAGEAEQICKVDRDTVVKQCGKSCATSGTPSDGCCEALRHADFGCLCHDYWEKLKAVPAYARCAEAVPSKCGFPNAKCH